MFAGPELRIVLVICVVYGIPLLAGIWAPVSLRRIRAGQEAVLLRLENIERILQRS
jgi:hypothetical protein